jgi:hypothetical protein
LKKNRRIFRKKIAVGALGEMNGRTNKHRKTKHHMEKKIILKMHDGRTNEFRVKGREGSFIVYSVHYNLITIDTKRIGETRNLEDAIVLSKTCVDGSIRNVEIR